MDRNAFTNVFETHSDKKKNEKRMPVERVRSNWKWKTVWKKIAKMQFAKAGRAFPVLQFRRRQPRGRKKHRKWNKPYEKNVYIECTSMWTCRRRCSIHNWSFVMELYVWFYFLILWTVKGLWNILKPTQLNPIPSKMKSAL